MNTLTDFSPALHLLLLAATIALLPLSWVWLRWRRDRAQTRLALLTAVTLFLTFDLIVFGSFTRLTDSGLGCPDWPGCYGHASPIGASTPIAAAEQTQPTGPVTQTKAWIEMLHRYLAMAVGALCLTLAAASWTERRRLPHSPWWATATLIWIAVQGLFGKYTVTLKLYPLFVTLHLLGALALLMLLTLQRESFLARPLPLPRGLRAGAVAALLLLLLQVALGGWVSTNYAVLACSGFPQCNGQWLPEGDYRAGFTLLRELGHTAEGGLLPWNALVAIHYAHRVFALAALAALAALGWALRRAGGRGEGNAAAAGNARYGLWLLLLTLAQAATGISNVVLGWPIAAALLHSAGAAAMTLLLTLVLARSACAPPGKWR
jgi:cytochrome c oxidase assembly protein subunit 15